MKQIKRFLQLIIVGILLSFATSIYSQTTKSLFLIGNSVTDGINYNGLQALATSRGNTHIWGRHMIPGAPLSWIWDHSDGGIAQPPYGLYPNALGNYTWDAISLQPFDRPINGTGNDLDMIGNFFNLYKTKSPNVQLYIYSRYPRTTNDVPLTDASLTADAWNELWGRTFTGGWDTSNEAEDYFVKLLLATRTTYAMNKPALLVPVGDVMKALNDKMKVGVVPGYNNIWQFYADGIHMNNLGSYLLGCTFYATTYKDSPVGIGVPTEYGTISNSLATIIQQTVWEVVSTHPYAGIFGPATVAVSGISVTPTTTFITLNQTIQLNATIAPSSASNQGVEWKSSNSSIATIDAINGLVTGKLAGEATITATSLDGTKTATCLVTVSPTPIAVTGVSVTPTTLSIKAGNSSTLTTTIAPYNATNALVIWDSNNKFVATVNASGSVTAIASGNTTITATTADGAKAAGCNVTVTPNAAPVAVITATPITGTSPLLVSFNASSSSDADAGDLILGFEWDFGDGSSIDHSTAPNHTYTAAGTYTVKLRVMDNNNLYSSQVTKTIIVAQGVTTLAAWDFTGKGGQPSVVATTIGTGISSTAPSALTQVGAGISANNFLGNGFTAESQNAATLAEAITGNEYVTVTITPESGKSISISSVKFRPVSQNRTRSISLFSSQSGFDADNAISTLTASSYSNPLQTIAISNHTNITTPTEFRLYFYGYTNGYEIVGLGERQAGLPEKDLIIEGTVSSTTSISNLRTAANQEITLFPNPANNTIYLQANTAISTVTIYSANGQMVKTQTTNRANGVDVTDLPRGIYFVEVQTLSGNGRTKFIKE